MESGTDAWKDDKKHEINRKWNYPERWKLNEKRKKIKDIYSCLTLKVQTNQVILLNWLDHIELQWI